VPAVLGHERLATRHLFAMSALHGLRERIRGSTDCALVTLLPLAFDEEVTVRHRHPS
jgi:hypothetical protein